MSLLVSNAGQKGVASVITVVIGCWPGLVLSPVEHVSVPTLDSAWPSNIVLPTYNYITIHEKGHVSLLSL